MKVLLANYRYFVSGGPERYLFNITSALEKRGHEVIPFSIRYNRNEPTPYAKYFVEPLAGPDAVYFNDHARSPSAIWKTLERAFYSREVERGIRSLVQDTGPDVAYVLHYLRKLSPALLVGLKKEGIPIVVRISDFLMMCPASHFLRDGKPCTLCLDQHSLRPSLRYRCVKGSLSATWVHYLCTMFHRWRRYYDLIDRFVVPSEFTLSKMAEAGWPEEKLIHLPSFVHPFFLEGKPLAANERDRVVYTGHLEHHKGADLLIEAYVNAYRHESRPPPRLVVIAGKDGSLAENCRAASQALPAGAVEFTGFLQREEVRDHMRRAVCTVVPSRCFENMPQSIIESYACGTPVIGAGHGSIAPLIEDGVTGRVFEPGSIDDLAEKLQSAWSDRNWCEKAGRQARAKAEISFTESAHTENLLNIFTELAEVRRRENG